MTLSCTPWSSAPPRRFAIFLIYSLGCSSTAYKPFSSEKFQVFPGATLKQYGRIGLQTKTSNDEIQFGDIVVACGSGGTIAGLALGSKLSNWKAKVHAFSVCDDPNYFYNYTQGLLDGLQAGVESRNIVNIQDNSLSANFHPANPAPMSSMFSTGNFSQTQPASLNGSVTILASLVSAPFSNSSIMVYDSSRNGIRVEELQACNCLPGNRCCNLHTPRNRRRKSQRQEKVGCSLTKLLAHLKTIQLIDRRLMRRIWMKMTISRRMLVYRYQEKAQE